MSPTDPPPPSPPSTAGERLAAYAVHCLTAAGMVFALLAAIEILSAECDPRWVFVWFIAATVVDAVDGPLARRFDVWAHAPGIDGRKIDDITDYLTYTFLPLLLVHRMAWLPTPPAAPAWLGPALLAAAAFTSVLGFANTSAKEEAAGFFRGFPSYWNIVAFYAGLIATFGDAGRWTNALLFAALAVLTVAPVRFLYPNLAPGKWRLPMLVGGYAWALLVLCMLPWYPTLPTWAVALSAVYPVVYTVASLYLDHVTRRSRPDLPV